MNLEKIKLSFADEEAKERILTIDYPKDQISGTEIKIAMDNIIASQVLLGKESVLGKKVKAYKEKVERSEYNIK